MKVVVRPKKELRQEYRTILQNLDTRWVFAASHRITRALQEFFEDPRYNDVKHILCFAAFFPGEVDLTSFITSQFAKRSMYLPRVSSDGNMKFISIGSDWQSSSSAGEYGIPEPETGKFFDSSNSSKAAILVPGLVFDLDGNRLGRGKGYYDRFLQQREFSQLIHLGICWDSQILDEVPTEAHDVLMHYIISEERSISVVSHFEDE